MKHLAKEYEEFPLKSKRKIIEEFFCIQTLSTSEANNC